jgi:alkylation response protein AidB-like acyl-CoA dehydrogenase
MEFALTEEQQQLKDSLRRYLDREYSFESRRQQIKSQVTCAPAHWQAFAEFGLLGLGIDEAHGGTGTQTNIGGTGVAAEDTMIVMLAFGRALVVEPYLATVVLCGSLLQQYASDASEAKCAQKLSAIAAGETRMSLAVHERAGRYQYAYVATTATREGDSYIINGQKSVVIHGDVADAWIVSARTSGATGDSRGISLFLIDKATPNVTVRGYATNDGLSAADLSFNQVRLPLNARIGVEGGAYPAIEQAIGFGISAICAEAVGAMEALCEVTLEYLKNRKQFGVAIGSFQALQHRMVDMFIATEQARSISMLAALKVGAADVDSDERRRVLAAAKSLVGQSARYVGQQAVQLHGGMGVTEELSVSHYFKRLTAIDMTFGDAHYQRAQLGDLLAA